MHRKPKMQVIWYDETPVMVLERDGDNLGDGGDDDDHDHDHHDHDDY